MRKIIEDFVNAYKHCASDNTEASIYDLYETFRIVDGEDFISYNEVLFIIRSLRDCIADDASLDDTVAESLYYYLSRLSIKSFDILYIQGNSRMLYALKHSLISDGIEYQMSTPGYEKICINQDDFENIIHQLAISNAVLSTLDFQWIISIIFWSIEPFENIQTDLKKVLINFVNKYGKTKLVSIEFEILKEITSQ